MPTNQFLNPHLEYKCFGYYGYYFGIVRAKGQDRGSGCTLCVLNTSCTELTRLNGAKAFPRVFEDWATLRDYDKMWIAHGCFDPFDSVIIKNEEDGLTGQKPGHGLRVSADLRLPLIGMGEVFKEDG